MDVLAVEPYWAKALHIYFWFLTNQGDTAGIRATLIDAGREYEETHHMAKRLATGDPTNTAWQRDLSVSYNSLGDASVSQGKLDPAAVYYGQCLEIAKQLVAGDLTNTGCQRELWVSYWRLSDLSERQKRDEKAQGYWNKALEVLLGIKKRGLHL